MNLQVTADNTKATAVHEAAHCVAAIVQGRHLCKRGARFTPDDPTTEARVSIRQTGVFSRDFARAKKANETTIVYGLAGPMAQFRLCGWDCTDAQGDNANVDINNIAEHLKLILPESEFLVSACRGLEMMPGGDLRRGCPTEWAHAARRLYYDVWALCVTESSAEAFRTDTVEPPMARTEHGKVLGPLADRAHGIIDKHWDTIETLADELLRVKNMSGPEVEQFVKRQESSDTRKTA
jgi:hypothetical protein